MDVMKSLFIREENMANKFAELAPLLKPVNELNRLAKKEGFKIPISGDVLTIMEYKK